MEKRYGMTEFIQERYWIWGWWKIGGMDQCVIQSKSNDHILVTCYNRNIYLFTPPNIDYYIKN